MKTLVFVMLWGLHLALIAAASPPVSKAPSKQPESRGRCRIEVTRHLKSGKNATHVSWVKTRDQQDCAKFAKLHETNYTPDNTLSKRVRWKWE